MTIEEIALKMGQALGGPDAEAIDKEKIVKIPKLYQEDPLREKYLPDIPRYDEVYATQVETGRILIASVWREHIHFTDLRSWP